MLQTKQLTKTYDGEKGIFSLDLALYRGEIRAILGPNGAGKTTSFQIISGVEFAHSGRVLLNEKDVTYWPLHKKADRGLCYLPQRPSLFRGASVIENILILLENLSSTDNQNYQTAQEMLNKLGIQKRAHDRISELSAGLRRKVEIARSLATSPNFLLLDEPFTGLDPLSTSELKEIILQLRDEENLGLVLTDHRVEDILSVTDYNYIIQGGKQLVEGNSAEIKTNSTVQQIYLGGSELNNSRSD